MQTTEKSVSFGSDKGLAHTSLRARTPEMRKTANTTKCDN